LIKETETGSIISNGVDELIDESRQIVAILTTILKNSKNN
jgi:hypothetical protein